MRYKTVIYEKSGPIATVILNRPGASNAVNTQMAAEIRELVQEVRDDAEVKVIVLRGAGEAFCVGTELDLVSMAGTDTSSEVLQDALNQHRIAKEIACLQCPVIAAINGDAIGQGLELTLACDIRLAAESARMGLDQIHSGLLPWDGATQRLPRLLGRGMALSLVLLGEPIDAREALRIGLAHQVFPKDTLRQETLRLAERIATYSPIALRYAKEVVNKGMEMTLDQGLRLETDLTVILQTTEDRAEGIDAFLKKRPPRFTGK